MNNNFFNQISTDLVVGIPGSELKSFFSKASLTIIPSREDEALAISSGLTLNGVDNIVVIQSSGAGNIINALSSFILPYNIPLKILISLRGGELENNEAQKILGSKLIKILLALELNILVINRLGEILKEYKNPKYKTNIYIYTI
ncbi:hypothetical protein GH131_10465 [Staphylococcus pseudintermedius]|nr:hypothetical protein [Staphylococcus pseudintermedius]